HSHVKVFLAFTERYVCCVIFFFQAEDGIRDRNVTGVQTCALPIFGLNITGARDVETDSLLLRADVLHRARREQREIEIVAASGRSEERRVGKECSSR